MQTLNSSSIGNMFCKAVCLINFARFLCLISCNLLSFLVDTLPQQETLLNALEWSTAWTTEMQSQVLKGCNRLHQVFVVRSLHLLMHPQPHILMQKSIIVRSSLCCIYPKILIMVIKFQLHVLGVATCITAQIMLCLTMRKCIQSLGIYRSR